MRLSDEELKELRVIALDAVTNEDELALWLRDGTGIRLERIAKPDGLENRMDTLIQWLETRNRTIEFIDLLIKERPHLAAPLAHLREVAAKPPQGLDYLRTRLDGLRGRIADHPFVSAGGALAPMAGAAAAIWILVTPPDLSEPLEPIHAPQIWKDAFVVRGERIAYASPDTTYQLLEERLNSAEKSILIAMYEFTSPDVAAMLLDAVERKVKVRLLVGSRSSQPDAASTIEQLTSKGVEVIYAPRGGRGRRTYHSKLIIIDTRWVLVQTGNLTPTSVPPPGAKSGNRDVGIAVDDAPLAEYFTRLFNHDNASLTSSTGAGSDEGSERVDPVYPAFVPVQRFPLLRIGEPGPDKGKPAPSVRPTRILAVYAPENYAANLQALLESAQHSVDIAAPYMNARENARTLQQLLDAIKTARLRNPNLKVRVILGRLDTKRTAERLRACCSWLSTDEMRVLNSRSGLNLMSRLVIVDGRVAVVGSANWSEPGFSSNREIGLLIDSPPIAKRYGEIFDADWDGGVKIDAADNDDN